MCQGRYWALPMGLFAVFVASGQAPPSPPTGLAEYAHRADPSFAWTKQANHDTEQGRLIELDVTSQTWNGAPWSHKVRLYEPKTVTYPDSALLFITGGSTGREPKPEDHAQGFALAALCGARVVVLPQVPNQPLLDGKTEDDLIGETFMRFLATKDQEWPLLRPMVKSAVRAMDAAQQFAEEDGKPIKSFVVTGASKRGWTTWLTGAVDPRVIAIAPMVIPTLNMKAQSQYQLDSWGKYSEQIEDYTRRGLTDQFDTPDGSILWKMVDPYSYLDRIKVPVLQINGTNDRYWTLDSMNLYWDDIKAPKYVVYLPNAGHSLEPNRDWATHGVGALFRHAASGRAMPALSWTFEEDDDQTMPVRLDIKAEPQALGCKVWTARSDTKDFRESEWTADPSTPGRGEWYRFRRNRPNSGYFAYFADLTYEIDGLEYHLSTQVRIVGAKPVE